LHHGQSRFGNAHEEPYRAYLSTDFADATAAVVFAVLAVVTVDSCGSDGVGFHVLPPALNLRMPLLKTLGSN
jgi:hypothetical protein